MQQVEKFPKRKHRQDVQKEWEDLLIHVEYMRYQTLFTKGYYCPTTVTKLVLNKNALDLK